MNGVARRRWIAVSVAMVGGFITLMDTTIVNTAIPSITEDLRARPSAIEWVVSGYALTYGLVLVLAGRLGDLYGQRRLFVAGVALFTVTSVLCGTAADPSLLVTWRAVQGLGAGLLYPQIAATVQTCFPAGERGRAFAVFGIIQGLATVAGPLLGGLLISADIAGLKWRPIFLVNLPIGLVTIIAARTLPSGRVPGAPRSLDTVGVVLLGVSLMALLLPLIEGHLVGWPPWTFATLAGAVPLFALFALWERRLARARADPLVRPELLHAAGFPVGVVLFLAYFAGFTSIFFTLSLFLQLGQGSSALQAGIALVPFALGTPIGAGLSTRAARRLGRGAVQIGAAVVLLAFVAVALILRRYGTAVSARDFAVPLFVGGFGSGLVIAPLNDIALLRVPVREAGAASGVLSTGQRVGTAVGVALVGVVFFAAVDGRGTAAGGGGGGASGGGGGHSVAVRFAAGMRDSAWVNVGLLAATLLLSLFLPRGRPTDAARSGELRDLSQPCATDHRDSSVTTGF